MIFVWPLKSSLKILFLVHSDRMFFSWSQIVNNDIGINLKSVIASEIGKTFASAIKIMHSYLTEIHLSIEIPFRFLFLLIESPFPWLFLRTELAFL